MAWHIDDFFIFCDVVYSFDVAELDTIVNAIPQPFQKSPDDPSSLVPAIAIEDLAQIVPSALPLGERSLFLATVEWQGASVLVGYLELATWEESDSRIIIHA
mgnify:CR=1 FL=1